MTGERLPTGFGIGNRGLHYGDGLFETMAVRHGRPVFWDRHYSRLQDGCNRLQLECPDTTSLLSEIARVAGREEISAVKLIVIRGEEARGYRPTGSGESRWCAVRRPWPDCPASYVSDGVAVRWCDTRLALQPRLAGIKHLNRLEQVLARAEWRDEFAEGLMRDTNGLVIEGTFSNLFLVKQGTLITPDLSQSGVAGVTRAAILDLAGQSNIPTTVQPVTVSMVEQADELFLTSSLIGLWPVARLEARQYAVAGQVSKILQAALHAARGLA